METENNQLLWKSRSGGHKAVAILLALLGVLALIIGCVFIIASNDNVSDDAKLVLLILAIIIMVSSLGVVVIVKRTDLKWNVSNLLFGLAESGLYFTGVAKQMQTSYFFAEWSEILDYSLATDKKGRVTVTVNFNGTAYAGSYGRIKHLQMVNITDVDEMCKVFEKFGINQTGLSKN